MALRWPSPSEALSIFSLFVAAGSLAVSISGYLVTRETANAQKENLLILCKYKYRDFAPATTDYASNREKESWVARIFNNSRAPVNIASLAVDIVKKGGDFGGSLKTTPETYSKEKYGAEYSLQAEGIFLEAGQSTSVGFDEAINLTSEQAQWSGGDPIEPLGVATVILTAETSRGNRFSGTCPG